MSARVLSRSDRARAWREHATPAEVAAFDARIDAWLAETDDLGHDPKFRVSQAELDNADALSRTAGRSSSGGDTPVDPAVLLAETEAWLATLGRKVEIVDVEHRQQRAATLWLRSYSGSFDFLVDLRAKGGVRTVGQAKAVLNCWRAQIGREAAATAPSPAVPVRAAETSDPMLAAVLSTLGVSS